MASMHDEKLDHPFDPESEDRDPVNGLDRLIISVGHALSLFFLVSAIIIVWEIIARYVFNSPTFWVHETTTLICAILFAYGGSYCVARDKHIRVVFFYDAVPPGMRRWLDVLISLLCILYAAGLSWAGWLVVEKSIFTPKGALRLETSGSAWDPPFPAFIKMFLFLMLSVMLIQFVLGLFASLKGHRGV